MTTRRRIGFLSALRRWWAFIALALGAGGLLGYAYASRVTPMYEAEAKLVVGSPAATIDDQRAAGQLAPTYAELVTTRELLQPTLRRLGLPFSHQEWEGKVRGEAGEQNRVLTIRVRSEEAARAIRVANALAAELTRFAASHGPTGTGAAATTPDVELRVVEGASRAARIRPQTVLAMEFGALSAGFAALAVCLVIEAVSRRVRDEEDLARVAPVVLGPVNGRVPSRSDGGDHSSWAADWGDGNPYRALARQLGRAGEDGPLRSLLILGAQGGTGSGAVALNLAAALAGPKTRVVLIDLSSPREILRLVERRSTITLRGTPVRHGRHTLDRFLVQPGSALALAFPRVSEPRATTVEEAEALVAQVLEHTEVVVVHAPSLLGTPAALAWARAVNGTLVVARRRHTSRASVTDALESLGHARTNVVGTVLHEGRTA
jgi:succinoglycan biosynthesis transport protein ExoP